MLQSLRFFFLRYTRIFCIVGGTMLSIEKRCKIATRQKVLQSPIEVQRCFRAEFGIHYAPSRHTIYAIHAKFIEAGSVNDQP